MKRQKQALKIELTVESIVERGNLMEQFQRLEEEGQQKAPDHHSYRLIRPAYQPSPEMMELKKRHDKLINVLRELDKTNPNEARDAAVILVGKLNGIYKYYYSAQRRPKPTQQGFSYLPNYSTYENALIPPKQLLEALETEFTDALKPIWHIRPHVKAAIMLLCGVCAAVVMVSLCITAMIFLPQWLPVLKPAVSLMATPLGHTPHFLSIADIPLINMSNVISASVGALVGSGSSFFAMRGIEAWRFRDFRACVNAVKQFSEKAQREEQDSTKKEADNPNNVFHP